MSVLGVEDNAVAACALNFTLTDLGAKVTLAETGKEALNFVASQHFDFIILDFDLPDMKGPDIAKQIRQWEAEKKESPKPLFLLTASLDSKREQRCIEAGIDVVFTKPLTAHKIQRICRKLKEHLIFNA